MDRQVRVMVVNKVERSAPFVRVVGDYSEGGTSAQSAVRTEMSFLVSGVYDQPKVGDELVVFIRPKTDEDQHTPIKEWTA